MADSTSRRHPVLNSLPLISSVPLMGVPAEHEQRVWAGGQALTVPCRTRGNGLGPAWLQERAFGPRQRRAYALTNTRRDFDRGSRCFQSNEDFAQKVKHGQGTFKSRLKTAMVRGELSHASRGCGAV